MRFEFFIASRYLKKKKHNLFISYMSIISITMVVLFVSIPILTSSVTNGFQLNIIDKVLTFDFHLRIEDPQRSFLNSSEMVNKLKQIKGVKNVHQYFQEKALIKKFGQNFLANLRGVKKSNLKKNIFGKSFRKIEGSCEIVHDDEIILAEALANNLFVRSGDYITVAVINSSDSVSPFNTLTLKVKGIFTAGYARYDSFLAYTSLNTMRKLTRSNPKLITTLGIYLDKRDKPNIDKFIKKLKTIPIFKNFRIINSHNNDIFREFRKEKKLISLILYIAILLSFLNIYITLNVIVVEKQKDIGILKSYGVKMKTIQRVFTSEGILIGILGATIGVVVGLFLTINIKEICSIIEFLVNSLNKVWSYAFNTPAPAKFEIMPIEKFYLTTLPYKIEISDVIFQATGAILAAIFSAYLPAKRASKKRPIEVLRYE